MIGEKKDKNLELLQNFSVNFAGLIFNEIYKKNNPKIEWSPNNNDQKIQFEYDKNNDCLIQKNISEVDLSKDNVFMVVGGVSLMISKSQDDKVNVYVFSENRFKGDEGDENGANFNCKIENISIEKAKKFTENISSSNKEKYKGFAFKIKSKQDFRFVFEAIISNSDVNLENIISQREACANVLKNFQTALNKSKVKINNNVLVEDIKFNGFDEKSVKLNFDIKSDQIKIDNDKSNKLDNLNFSDEDFYFYKNGLFLVIPKCDNDNGVVNIYAINDNVCEQNNNPYGSENNINSNVFVICGANKKDASSFIKNLNNTSMDRSNYDAIYGQEDFENFFNDHCKPLSHEYKDDNCKNNGICSCNLCKCGCFGLCS